MEDIPGIVVRRTHREWARLVRQWQRSGKTARAFGDERGVNANTLSCWKWQLGSIFSGWNHSIAECIADPKASAADLNCGTHGSTYRSRYLRAHWRYVLICDALSGTRIRRSAYVVRPRLCARSGGT